MKKPILVITPGDPAGIGPEITWKAICQNGSRGSAEDRPHLLCVGAREPFEKMGVPIQTADPQALIPPTYPISANKIHGPTEPYVWLLPAPTQAPQNKLLEGYQSGWSIQMATDLVLKNKAQALVTGPISKDRLQKGGYLYPGHTEFLAHLCGVPSVTMMLANKILKVALVTTHLGVQDVSAALTREKIRQVVDQTVSGLRDFWHIKRPRIALTALNPHGGENGLFGREEIETIGPEIQALNRDAHQRYEISGPFPADTFFAKHFLTRPEDRHDAVVAMYHDQGLIPVKLLDFHHTVNVTLGLPMIRTSVDHGVGFDIAGKGRADPSSLISAIELATYFVQKKE